LSFGQAFTALFLSLTLTVLGLWCLLRPKTMQGYALKHSAKRWLKNSSLEWMNTTQYLRYLRLMGSVMFIVGTWVTIIFAKKCVESLFI